MTTSVPQLNSADLPRALNGLRVLDIGHWLAGPFGATLLADFGADVLKVERPGGQGLPTENRIGWAQDQRNKRGITLALDHPKGRAIFLDLINHYDVVVENFRPGTMEKLGLGYDVLSAANPRVILTRVSGFGQTGPFKDRPSFDRIGIAMAGLTYTSGYTDRPPVRPGFMVGDYGTGLTNAFATLIAVYNRDVVGTGLGQEVDVSLFESVFRLSGTLISQFDRNGVIRERSDNLVPGISPGDQFETKDGRWIVIHGGADHHFRAVFNAVGLSQIADAPEFATLKQRAGHTDELNDMIRPWVRDHTCDEVLEQFVAFGVPVGAIYSAKDIVEDEHYAARGDIVTVDDPELGPIKQPAPLPKLSRTPGHVYTTAPFLGQHNRDVYGGVLGMSDAELAELASAGVI